jgi:capsular exopolysaccharide synthesis family protein
MISLSEFLKAPHPSTSGVTALRAKTLLETSGIAPELRRVRVEEVQVPVSSRITFHTDPQSAVADRFRFVRMRLRPIWETGKLRSLLITSPLPGDGKSTIALNLATALAEGGKRAVLLVDGDFYHPTLAPALGLQNEDGFAECIEGELDPWSAIRRIEPLGWYLLPAGKPGGNPTELLQSGSVAQVLQTISPCFDWILFDSPPVVPLVDALALSRHTDASLLVVRADRTPCETVREALTLLGPKQALGLVLNGAEGLDKVYSKYYGYYRKK